MYGVERLGKNDTWVLVANRIICGSHFLPLISIAIGLRGRSSLKIGGRCGYRGDCRQQVEAFFQKKTGGRQEGGSRGSAGTECGLEVDIRLQRESLKRNKKRERERNNWQETAEKCANTTLPKPFNL